MAHRLTYKYVKTQFENKGFTLLSDEYINTVHKLKCMCSNGHIILKSYRMLRDGHGCQKCEGERRRLQYSFVRDEMKKDGYILISKKYTNSIEKLCYICPNGHTHSISWGKWQQGERCPFCKSGVVGSNVKLNLKYIKHEFGKVGCKVLSDVYVNAHTPLSCVCSNGHKFKLTWADFKHSSRGCSVCAHIKFIVNRCGDGNPAWRGGITCDPYCQVWSDKEYKESIKERDGFKCQNLDCSRRSNKLVLHHINYNKKLCGPENLITICNSCNAKANKERDWHTSWYQAIMHNKYGYNYE